MNPLKKEELLQSHTGVIGHRIWPLTLPFLCLNCGPIGFLCVHFGRELGVFCEMLQASRIRWASRVLCCFQDWVLSLYSGAHSLRSVGILSEYGLQDLALEKSCPTSSCWFVKWIPDQMVVQGRWVINLEPICKAKWIELLDMPEIQPEPCGSR